MHTEATTIILQKRLQPYVEHIESECALAVSELLGTNRRDFSLTTGTRLDIIRSLEGARAACDSMRRIIWSNSPKTSERAEAVL